MKKILIVLILLTFLLPSLIFAQKAKKGDFLTEAILSLNGGSSTITGVTTRPFDYGLKVRYALRDKWILRLSFSGNYQDSKSPESTNSSNNNQTFTSGRSKSSNISILPGIEYHFKGGEKISPYIYTCPFFSQFNNSNSSETNNQGILLYSNNSESKSSNLGIQIGTGIDMYVFEGFFIGFELYATLTSQIEYKGFYKNFNSSSNPQEAVRTYSGGNFTSLNGGATGSGIRIGYKF